MNIRGKSIRLLSLIWIISSFTVHSQVLQNIRISDKPGLNADSIVFSDSSALGFPHVRSLFSFLLNNKRYYSGDIISELNGNRHLQTFDKILNVSSTVESDSGSGLQGEIIFENRGEDTISISNVVPFGEDNSSVYITGKGPSDLARAWLFRPGFRPVRVILPDNAWEMGYSSFNTGNDLSVCAMVRRKTITGGKKARYETVLPPKAQVSYSFHADVFRGDWQNGLRIMFRDRYLYDLDKFDNTLFEREDLAWIKSSYLIVLQMAWDKDFYDRLTGKYTYPDVIKKGIDLFGNIDVYGIWPTWPRLGVDQRNQWDLYRDLPGGIHQLRNFVKMSQQSGTRFFIAYNPWDNSTRSEDHYKGMARLLAETDADGVVLDTKGSSSYELQAAADSVKKGVVMYSEGMAVPKDMPGIIAGRVHNAIYLSPELNLNKLIKPDFSIFRVCDVGEDIIHREVAIAFFNGYGTELNMFRPGGRDDNYRDDLDYLSHTTYILRQNNDAFLDKNWIPLIETTVDNVFVNKWESGDKIIYTILNMSSEGIYRSLFKVKETAGRHFISLWNHEELVPVNEVGETYIRANIPGWDPLFTGTRKEGSVDCIADLPDLIKSNLTGDSLKIRLDHYGRILIWKGNPSYQAKYWELKNVKDTTISTKNLFGYYEGKIVLQLVENKILKDESILKLKGGRPWIISKMTHTKGVSVIPDDMVLVPGSPLTFNVTANDDFITYPEINGSTVKVDSFLIDKYPVTNAQYYDFIIKSGYQPSDTARYLRHWQSGIYKQGQDKYPVVYVSYEDMTAYAKWAKKRLPTEAEWQLAAQGTDNRKWPWGDEFHGTYCNNSFDRPTPVDAFPKGQSPFGVVDVVGNVWQMTSDMYFNGTNYFTIIRGGSYYKPDSSWWYVQGGPQPLDKTQMLLMVSPGFDRCSTVGFRCVKDIDNMKFNMKK